MGGRNANFWLWDFAVAAGKALHSKTLAGALHAEAVRSALSVGREVKTEIPVYNDVEIDAAKIVWARDMGEKYNAERLQYFRDR